MVATLVSILSITLPLNPNANISERTQAVEGTIAEYDLLSGCKLGSTETSDSPVVFQYTADATTIVGLTQVTTAVANPPLLLWQH